MSKQTNPPKPVIKEIKPSPIPLDENVYGKYYKKEESVKIHERNRIPGWSFIGAGGPGSQGGTGETK